MNRLKSFVIKYQLWITLISIILYIVMLFSPMYTLKFTYIRYGDRYKTIIDNKVINYQIKKGILFNMHDIFNILIVVFVVAYILLSICYLIKKKKIFLNLSCSCSILSFVFIVSYIVSKAKEFNFSHIDDYSDEILTTIPHVAFYIGFIIFIFCTIVLAINIYIHYKSTHPNIQTKSERIAELEKRVQELEANKKDGE